MNDGIYLETEEIKEILHKHFPMNYEFGKMLYKEIEELPPPLIVKKKIEGGIAICGKDSVCDYQSLKEVTLPLNWGVTLYLGRREIRISLDKKTREWIPTRLVASTETIAEEKDTEELLRILHNDGWRRGEARWTYGSFIDSKKEWLRFSLEVEHNINYAQTEVNRAPDFWADAVRKRGFKGTLEEYIKTQVLKLAHQSVGDLKITYNRAESRTLEVVLDPLYHGWCDLHAKTIDKIYQWDKGLKESIVYNKVPKELRELENALNENLVIKTMYHLTRIKSFKRMVSFVESKTMEMARHLSENMTDEDFIESAEKEIEIYKKSGDKNLEGWCATILSGARYPLATGPASVVLNWAYV